MPEYHSLSINNIDDFIFGISPHPILLKNGMIIGGGTVIPELNFTLPDMIVDSKSMPEVCIQYTQMVTDASKRAVELHTPGLVVEFELLPDLTLTPDWGAEVVKILKEVLNSMENQFGIRTALRVTPNDIREFARPPIMNDGEFVDKMYRCFHLCGEAGADFFSIESTGGKEIHDDAILNCNLDLSVFGLGILGSRDMVNLWKNIVDISHQHGVIPAGDSACGFANTAMVLAEQRYIPKVWAALIRVMSVPRSLIAFEQGAQGPGKDCAYEGPYIKAITGCPISLEGAEAAVAHLSSIGNIAKAVPDLWSNESVNNVKLLGGMAPTVSLEQLVYATRLLNTASNHGKSSALMLRDWLVGSDAKYDPQAYVLKPDVVLELAKEIIQEPSAYLRTRKAAQVSLMKLRQAGENGELAYSKIEMRWLDRLSKKADSLPEDEEEFIKAALVDIDHNKIRLEEYGIVG
jgi:methanol--5-hydroxybenzimidazolylcobamide Co-methyltransferase